MEHIVNNLNDFGIDAPLIVAIEPKVINLQGRLIAEPDVYVIDSKNSHHCFEYKTHEHHLNRARRQLRTVYSYVNRRYGINPLLYIVYGSDYTVVNVTAK